MGLYKKDFKNEMGIPCEYWRISRVTLDIFYRFCDISFVGYRTKEDRDSGNDPVMTQRIKARWSAEEFGSFFTPDALHKKSFYEACYEFAKTKGFFDDSDDELNHIENNEEVTPLIATDKPINNRTELLSVNMDIDTGFKPEHTPSSLTDEERYKLPGMIPEPEFLKKGKGK